MFTLLHARASAPRCLLSGSRAVLRITPLVPPAPRFFTALPPTRAPAPAPAPAVKRPRKPFYPEGERVRSLIRHLLEQGAPPPSQDNDPLKLTNRELEKWISQSENLPAPPQQYEIARYMISQGAPQAELVIPGMSMRALAEWIQEAKTYTSYLPLAILPQGETRQQAASDAQLHRAGKLAAKIGLTPPYHPAKATKGEVSDFIIECREELVRQGRPNWLPTTEQRDAPATQGQIRKLQRFGVVLPPLATRGEASDRITEIQKEKGVVVGQW